MNSQIYRKIGLAILLLLSLFIQIARAASGVPAGIKNDAYDQLLKKYVNSQGLVAYEKWKANAEDMKALDDYLAQFGAGGSAANGTERYASLVNAYNGFVLQWILRNYPT